MKLKIKNKIKFSICVMLYVLIIITLIVTRPNIAEVGPMSIALCVISLVSGWQLKVDNDTLTKYVLSMFVVSLVLGFTAPNLLPAIMGQPRAISEILTVIIVFGIIIGVPVLIITRIAKRNGVGFNDAPLIKAEAYSPDERIEKIKKANSVARRQIFSANISTVAMMQIPIVVAEMIIVPMVAEFTAIELPMKIVSVYIYIAVVSLIIWAVTAIWSVIAGKRLEVMLIKLGEELQGIRELTEYAKRANFKNNVARMAEVPVAFGADITQAFAGLSKNYLLDQGLKVSTDKRFKKVSIALVVMQIVFSLTCLMIYR